VPEQLILVVEDEPTLAEAVAARLRAERFAVQFDLLHCLAGAPGAVFTRAQLLERIWDWTDASRTRSVDSHVKALRRKLGPGLIRTVHGVGYALKVPA
jgi:DNA-binding response OmpR family regulator